ncbi:efflux RND transporter periplasmic adaptor subunit [Sphingosinicellaceae bacterium]|nr:efflux RND transporter periplasmic adaptor subunit [Sphingosinicellaceae bacterium]
MSHAPKLVAIVRLRVYKMLHRGILGVQMRQILIPAAVLVLALAACGKKQDGAGGPGGPGGGAPQVTVAYPLVKPIVDWDDYVGRFEAIRETEVRPRVSGYIKSINFRDGQFARVGQLLFVIDPRPFEAVLAQAKADAQRLRAASEVARTTFARTKTLLEANAVSKEEFEQAEATYKQAEASVAAGDATVRARALDVEFTRVTAPIAGRLSDRRLDVGNYVTAGTSVLTTIVALDPIYFTFTGSEAVYLKYQRANRAGTRPSSRISPNPVDIKLGDENEYRWRGKMNFVDNALDQGSGTIRGRAEVRNPDGFLTPGMFGHMRLLGSGAYNGMLIPEDAIVTDQSRKAALVVGKDDKVEQRVVELGPIVDGLRVVRSGLKPTDRVVIAGVQRGRPGTKVTIKQGRIIPPAPGTGPQVPLVNEPPATSATSAAAAR